MKAVIMAGGRGTRIAALAGDLPKPMLPIDGRPVLERELGSLREQGVTDVLITVGHLAPAIMEYFGDSIRTGANDCAEDEPDQSKVHFDLHLYEVFAKGYLSTAGASMSMAEKKSLAWGARLMTLECGIRFLTDYLEGDHYFHIARPDHNLDRARTQFTLVRQMEEVFDQMLEIVCPDNR